MKNLLLLFLFIVAAGISNAHPRATIDSLTLKVSPLFGKGITHAEAGKNTSARLVLHLSSTDSIAAIKVKLGSSNGAGDILDKTYAFIADGTSFVISNNTVYLSLGKFEQTGTYYAEVKLEYRDETVSGEVTASDN